MPLETILIHKAVDDALVGKAFGPSKKMAQEAAAKQAFTAIGPSYRMFQDLNILITNLPPRK